MRDFHLGDLLRGALGDDAPAAGAALGAEIDDPVGSLDHIEVVFDHHDGVAVVAQAVEHGEQLANVLEVQPGGGFVEDVERLAGVALGQFAGQLDALGLAAGEGGGALPQADVGEPHVEQRLQAAGDGRYRAEEFQRFLHGHLEHLVDALALVGDLQRLAVVALALAHVAGHVDVGQEVHLDLDHALALARLAAPALDVEREAPRLVAA